MTFRITIAVNGLGNRVFDGEIYVCDIILYVMTLAKLIDCGREAGKNSCARDVDKTVDTLGDRCYSRGNLKQNPLSFSWPSRRRARYFFRSFRRSPKCIDRNASNVYCSVVDGFTIGLRDPAVTAPHTTYGFVNRTDCNSFPLNSIQKGTFFFVLSRERKEGRKKQSTHISSTKFR